jgi:hypothetical protein
MRLAFTSGTSVNIWGYAMFNQVMYAMYARPYSSDAYSTYYFEAVDVHNPVMFNVRISQTVWGRFEVYVLCRNIFDDYNADPFNPGPGRMFYAGGNARF